MEEGGKREGAAAAATAAEEEQGPRAIDRTSQADSALKRCPVTVPNQKYAAVGIVACLPDEAFRKELEAQGQTMDTQFLLKIYGCFSTRKAAENHCVKVHPHDPVYTQFVGIANAPLPIPLGDGEGKDLDDLAESAVGRYARGVAEQESEQESEMTKRCDAAVKKGKKARKQAKERQQQYLSDRGPSLPITQEAAGSMTGRNGLHVEADKATSCWRLKGMDADTQEAADAAMDELLASRLGALCFSRKPRKEPGSTGWDPCITMETGKALAEWAAGVAGVPKETVKIYLRGPGDRMGE